MKPTASTETATTPADGEVGDASAIATPDAREPGNWERVTDALKKGQLADFDAWQVSEPDVSLAAQWDETRTLSAAFISQLCVSTSAATARFPRGIRIQGARIVGDIDLATATIDTLLLLERCRIEGNISLRDSITRLVNLARSRVTGSVDADRLQSSGGVYLRRQFTCDGEVRLSAAVIEGDLDCTDGKIVSKSALALRCDRMRVTGSVFFTNFEATGEVRLLDASVGANVVCKGASLAHPGKIALMADNVRIAGSLVLRDWKTPPDGEISLRNASANVLQLGSMSETWPNRGTVRAQGFRYSALETDGLVSLALCKRWLDLLVLNPFSPQPYEKCAQVLREIGLADDAKEIAIRRRRIQRGLPGVSMLRRLREVALDRLIGYGYRPGRSVAMLSALAVLGAGVFKVAQSAGAMVPSDSSVYSNDSYKKDHASIPPGYPPLNPVVYSLDVLLPIIDFQQDSKWRPAVGTTAEYDIGGNRFTVQVGKAAMYYMWLQIALGWILSTLLVASVTGLIRKE